MLTPKIYVACLASYNNGILHGRWIDAFQSTDAIFYKIMEILSESTIEDDQEWVIQNYEGFGEIKLSEYEDLETIVKYAKIIIEHGELGQALINNCGLEKAQVMKDYYLGSYESEVDFAQYLFENYRTINFPESWLCYFDYVAFAHDLFRNDYFAVEVGDQTHVFYNR